MFTTSAYKASGSSPLRRRDRGKPRRQALKKLLRFRPVRRSTTSPTSLKPLFRAETWKPAIPPDTQELSSGASRRARSLSPERDIIIRRTSATTRAITGIRIIGLRLTLTGLPLTTTRRRAGTASLRRSTGRTAQPREALRTTLIRGLRRAALLLPLPTGELRSARPTTPTQARLLRRDRAPTPTLSGAVRSCRRTEGARTLSTTRTRAGRSAPFRALRAAPRSAQLAGEETALSPEKLAAAICTPGVMATFIGTPARAGRSTTTATGIQ